MSRYIIVCAILTLAIVVTGCTTIQEQQAVSETATVAGAAAAGAATGGIPGALLAIAGPLLTLVVGWLGGKLHGASQTSAAQQAHNAALATQLTQVSGLLQTLGPAVVAAINQPVAPAATPPAKP